MLFIVRANKEGQQTTLVRYNDGQIDTALSVMGDIARQRKIATMLYYAGNNGTRLVAKVKFGFMGKGKIIRYFGNVSVGYKIQKQKGG